MFGADDEVEATVSGQRMCAILALSMIGMMVGADTSAVVDPEPREPAPPPPPPPDPRELWLRAHAPPEGTPPCPIHDGDGRRCALGKGHRRAPWLGHQHEDGWTPAAESRQVRRARARQDAKARRRRGR